jgi:hypothetical protein
MKRLAMVIALSTSLAGCGTSLTYSNGDVNWKAVAITSTTIFVGILLCNKYCEVGHNVEISGGELEVQVDATWSEEDSQRFRDDVDYLVTHQQDFNLPTLEDLTTKVTLP